MLAVPAPALLSTSSGPPVKPDESRLASSAAVVAEAHAADTIPRVTDFDLDGELGEWRLRSTDQVLPATPTTPQALVWIGQVERGLAVAAEIRTAGVSDVEDARLSIWLADADPPALPPVGWGHQFGFETLESEADCEAMDWGEELRAFCAQWYRDQIEHRSRLAPLFERRWLVSTRAPEAPIETLARPAFAAIVPEVRSKLEPLEPSSGPEARARPLAGTPGALGLEVLVPWEAFPPVKALDLSAVRVSVGMVAGDTGTEPAVPEGLLPRPLAAPLAHRLTPCGYGLRQIAIFSEPEIGVRLPSDQAGLYMIPDPSLDLSRLIVIDNEAGGYQYEPDSTSISPAAFVAEYSALELGGDEVLCGPFLAHKHGERVSDTVQGTRSGEESPWPFLVDARHMEARQLADGDWLVKEGPRVWWSYYGSGQCGACPRVGVRVHHVDTGTGAVTETLGFTQLVGSGVSDVEIEVSEDWLEVTAYELVTDWEADPLESHWKATRYCFRDAAAGQRPRYDVCGEEEPVPEPPKRLRLQYEEFSDP
jgi:hypothetical protein